MTDTDLQLIILQIQDGKHPVLLPVLSSTTVKAEELCVATPIKQILMLMFFESANFTLLVPHTPS